MVHSASFRVGEYNIMVPWGTCETDDEKVKEGIECQRMYDDILSNLKKYF